jgi:hypothetical protein
VYSLCVRTSFLLSVVLVTGTGAAGRAPVAATPSTTPTTSCEGWVALGGGRARSMVYTTYPLTANNIRFDAP